MTSFTKKTLAGVAAISGGIAAVFIDLGTDATKEIQRGAPAIMLDWQSELSPQAIADGWVTEIWRATNAFDLASFQHFTNTTGRAVVFPNTGPRAFFINRHRNTKTGQVTPWNTITTR